MWPSGTLLIVGKGVLAWKYNLARLVDNLNLLPFGLIFYFRVLVVSVLPTRMFENTVITKARVAKFTYFLWSTYWRFSNTFISNFYFWIWECCRGLIDFLVFKGAVWLFAIRIELAQSLANRFFKGRFAFVIKYAFLFIFACLVELAQNMVESAFFLVQPLSTILFKLAQRLFLTLHKL